MTTILRTAPALALAAILSAPVAMAGGSHDGGHDDGHGGGHAKAEDQGHMSGGHADSAGHGSMPGEPGDPAQASRTVEVAMHDNYYEPETIAVTAGETVRFVVRNEGALVHEFNIGTPSMHEAHADEMAMMVKHGVLMADRIDEAAAEAMQASMGHGKHDDPNSVLLEPGETGEVVWTFPEEAEVVIEFACNVPGHREAGMVGDVRLGHGS